MMIAMWLASTAFASDAEVPVKVVVMENAAQLKHCYERALKESPALEGRVTVSWRVEAGAVVQPLHAEDTTGSASLTACITEAIAGWSFPSDVTGDVTWPFVFKAAQADIHDVRAAFVDFTTLTLSGDEERDQKLLTDEMPQRLKAFEALATGVAEAHPDAAEEALYLRAKATLAFADLGRSILPPASFTLDEQRAFVEILEQKVFPQYVEVEKVGITRLDELGAQGKTVWAARARDEAAYRKHAAGLQVEAPSSASKKGKKKKG